LRAKLQNWAERLLIISISLLAFVGTLLLLRTVGSLWSQEASGWAQAIGGVAAIGAAYVFGERQANAALIAVREADRVLVDRRNASILAVVDATQAYCIQAAKAFNDGKVSGMHLRLSYTKKTMESHIAALESIPAHELGSYDAVSAFMGLRQSVHFFYGNVERARKKVEEAVDPETGRSPNVHDFGTTGIEICLRKNIECVDGLHSALGGREGSQRATPNT
jgi:hypothetical protein